MELIVDQKKRVANWCFTLNNPTEDECARLDGLVDMDGVDALTGAGSPIRYMAVANEQGVGGTPHLQGYLELVPGASKTLAAMKTFLFARAHYERRKGTPLQAAQYCAGETRAGQVPPLEEGRGRERGVVKLNSYLRREIGVISRQGARTDIASVGDAIRTGLTVTAMLDAGIINNANTLKYAEGLIKYLEPTRDPAAPFTVLWLVGPSGSGKTRLARLLGGDSHFVKKSETGIWYDGYDGQKCLILDDFRDSHMTFSQFLSLTDPQCQARVQTKGGSRLLSANLIIVTSVFPPGGMYLGVKDASGLAEPRTQFTRRITEVRTLKARTEGVMAPPCVLSEEQRALLNDLCAA